MPRKTLIELQTDPPRFTEAERARLNAMPDDAIDEAALADTEAQPMDDAQLARAGFARDVRRARDASGLTQAAFAERYQIALSRLRDWEQGRFKPDSVAVAYIKTIRHSPEAVARALAAAE